MRLAALLLAAAPAAAQDLPDLGGREIVVVTENAYPPLQFLDDAGTPVGWEYDFMAEAAQRLLPGAGVQIDGIDQGSVNVEDDGLWHAAPVRMSAANARGAAPFRWACAPCAGTTRPRPGRPPG